MRIVFLTAAILLALTFAACGDDDDEAIDDPTGDAATTAAGTSTAPAGDTIELVAGDFQFAPTVLELASGETYNIDFINTGQAKHSFTIDELDVSEEVAGNGELAFAFTAPDHNVEFYCQFHPDTMQGSITIGAAAADAGGSGGSGAGYSY